MQILRLNSNANGEAYRKESNIRCGPLKGTESKLKQRLRNKPIEDSEAHDEENREAQEHAEEN